MELFTQALTANPNRVRGIEFDNGRIISTMGAVALNRVGVEGSGDDARE